MRQCLNEEYRKGEYYETGYGMAVYAVKASNEKNIPVCNSSWHSGKYICLREFLS